LTVRQCQASAHCSGKLPLLSSPHFPLEPLLSSRPRNPMHRLTRIRVQFPLVLDEHIRERAMHMSHHALPSICCSKNANDRHGRELFSGREEGRGADVKAGRIGGLDGVAVGEAESDGRVGGRRRGRQSRGGR
jgi:hypothetical protein